jgi:hypothetical protein
MLGGVRGLRASSSRLVSMLSWPLAVHLGSVKAPPAPLARLDLSPIVSAAGARMMRGSSRQCAGPGSPESVSSARKESGSFRGRSMIGDVRGLRASSSRLVSMLSWAVAVHLGRRESASGAARAFRPVTDRERSGRQHDERSLSSVRTPRLACERE